MDVSTILNPLNTAQRQAVTSTENHLLVLAGAGSGKTRVLVHRIAYLVRVDGVSPYSILAVTFTNKAAREMRERIEQALDAPLSGMWIGTFHGLAHRLLKAHWKDAGLPENFQILDGDDQLRMVKRVHQALQLDEAKWPPKQSQWFINAQKDEGLRPQHLDDNHDPFIKVMKQVYQTYEAACQRGGVVDFAELLLRAHELWLTKPEILRHYQGRFSHILVDEFQDTNAIQYAWLRMLAGSVAQVTAVGDDDQSIYGWRGARIENIINFSNDFKDVTTVRLEQNYRSTNNILKAANAVIARNTGRLGKNLWTEGADGEPLTLYAAFNEQDEARFISDRIASWVKNGHSWDDVAVLYRSNAQSRVLEESLLRAGTPYRIYGGQRFYERLEIRNALAYLRLLASRNDDAALERVINTPTRGIGDKTVQGLRSLARDEGCSLWRACQMAVEKNMLPPRARNMVENFLSLIEKLDEQTAALDLDALADAVIRGSGLWEFHGKEKGERGQARLENLEELVSACKAYEAPDEDQPALPQFLAEAALDAGESQAESGEAAVQLMTMHSAKGLEFPLVILAGMEENLFPHKMSMEEPGRLEEERRLAYVGITRAEEKLLLTYAECRQMHGKENFNSISRFVKDIPSELIEEVRLKSQVSRPVSFKSSLPKTRGGRLSDEGRETGLSLGQRVGHKIFGEGVVLNFEGNGPNARVQVNFDSAGSKWLVLSFAKLEAI